MFNFFNEKMVMNGRENNDVFKARLKKKKNLFSLKKVINLEILSRELSNHRKALSGNLK